MSVFICNFVVCRRIGRPVRQWWAADAGWLGRVMLVRHFSGTLNSEQNMKQTHSYKALSILGGSTFLAAVLGGCASTDRVTRGTDQACSWPMTPTPTPIPPRRMPPGLPRRPTRRTRLPRLPSRPPMKPNPAEKPSPRPCRKSTTVRENRPHVQEDDAEIMSGAGRTGCSGMLSSDPGPWLCACCEKPSFSG